MILDWMLILPNFTTIMSKIWNKDYLPSLMRKKTYPSLRHLRGVYSWEGRGGGAVSVDCRIWILTLAVMTSKRFHFLF